MRELMHVNKPVNTVTGVSQRGSDQPSRETADLRTRKKKVDRSNAYKLTEARSGTDTSVAAVIRTWTQNGEETTGRISWTLVTSGLVRATDNGKREYDRRTEGGAL